MLNFLLPPFGRVGVGFRVCLVLHIKPKVHDVTVLHNVFLTFDT